MRVLDIDLDLFLNDRKINGNPSVRPSDEEYTPWTRPQLREFMEQNCGLDMQKPISGAEFTEHDELFSHLRKEFESGTLKKPIELFHLDAHADLGLGWNSTCIDYVMTTLLHLPVQQRTCPKIGGSDGLTPGSWLLFAVACRWIGSLVYVHHPKLTPGELGDIDPSVMKDYDLDGSFIQLKKLPKDANLGLRRPQEYDPISLEREIPIIFTPRSEFCAQYPFDRVFLTQSPGYVPPSADSLLDVIRPYIGKSPYAAV